MVKRERERVYICHVHPCRRTKQESNHWFVAGVDASGRFWADRFTKANAEIHGAVEICSEACLHTQLSRWTARQITAIDRPANPSPAVFDYPGDGDRGTMTAWVSTFHRTYTTHGIHRSEARVILYKDAGRDCQIWCFRPGVFYLIEACSGTHATFVVVKKGDYVNVTDVLEIEGQPARQFFEGAKR